jgi:hypothetical protein
MSPLPVTRNYEIQKSCYQPQADSKGHAELTIKNKMTMNWLQNMAHPCRELAQWTTPSVYLLMANKKGFSPICLTQIPLA